MSVAAVLSKRLVQAVGVAIVAASSMVVDAQTRTPFDLIIANGTVVDGTGAPGRITDIGIRSGRIAEIGVLQSAVARERISASGLIVSPGFVDVDTHADDIADHPFAEHFLQMGVTTIVAGNCGSSALNISDAFDRIRAVGISVNYATLIGHNTVRDAVMGSSNRLPSMDDLHKMKSLVFRAIIDGAVGFSTGLPYAPGTYARTNEITELARVSANEGGIYATHLRNEGAGLEASIKESITVARLIDGPLEISHLSVDSPSPRETTARAFAMIDEARKFGIKVQADLYAPTSGPAMAAIGDADVAVILRHPMVAIAADPGTTSLGQGLPHQRGFGDTARVLGKFVRENKVITLEEAIRKMTSLPAQFFGFPGRGAIRPGAFADLVIFDASKIASTATSERPRAFPVGIAAVLVNGVVTVRNGKHTLAKSGQIVTKPRK